LSQFKKYLLSGNLLFNHLGIFQSLKLRISVGKILPISLKLNFTPNTLGCHGLNHRLETRGTSRRARISIESFDETGTSTSKQHRAYNAIIHTVDTPEIGEEHFYMMFSQNMVVSSNLNVKRQNS